MNIYEVQNGPTYIYFVAPSQLGEAIMFARQRGQNLGPNLVTEHMDYLLEVSRQCNTDPYLHVWYCYQLQN